MDLHRYSMDFDGNPWEWHGGPWESILIDGIHGKPILIKGIHEKSILINGDPWKIDSHRWDPWKTILIDGIHGKSILFDRFHGKSILIDGNPWELNPGLHLSRNFHTIYVLYESFSKVFGTWTINRKTCKMCLDFGKILQGLCELVKNSVLQFWLNLHDFHSGATWKLACVIW